MNAAVEAIKAGDRMVAAFGMVVEAAADGAATVSMTVREDMLNSHAMTHGGVVYALADVAFALACNAGGRPAVAMHCAIDYLRPTHAGDRLTARATEAAAAGRTGVYDVAITDSNGATVATFRGTSRQISGR